MSQISERATRERDQHNEGLDRGSYNSVLSHTSFHFKRHAERLRDDAISFADGKRVLEFGSHSWVTWFEKSMTVPASLVCINISEVELQKGIDEAKTSRIQPTFTLMDANNLDFPDESFDMVYGGHILHHLDFTQALDEIHRVLKPNGRLLFAEPLDINPIAKLVRLLTPQARTVDEQPLRFREIAELNKRFSIKIHYQQFLSVPFGILSRLLFKSPENFLMKTVFKVDLALLRIFPPIRFLYRSILIVGEKADS